jgi:hypothetical protein
MASLGDLVVNLTANSSGLTSGLKDAEAKLSMFGAAVTAMAAGSVARFVQVGAGFDDMAQRTGVSVEALSSLQHVARMSDTSLEALQGSFMKLAKFMGDVREGSQAATGTLQALGLSASQMLASSPDQQFKLLADAIAGISDPSQQAAAAMSVFGKSAGEILPVLKLGSQGIQALENDAKNLGLVMTGQTAQAAAEADDAIQTLLATVDAAAVSFGANFARPLTVVAGMLSKVASQSKVLISVFAATVVAMYGVSKALQVITIAEQAYAHARRIALALSGPKGWALLAAGLVVAAVSASVLTDEFRRQNDALQQNLDLQEQQKNAAAQRQNTGGQGRSVLDVRAERLQAFQTTFNEMNTQSAQGQAEALRRKIAQLTDDFNTLRKLGRTDMTPEQFQQYKQAAVDAFTGAGEAAKKLQDELAILRGETTAQEQELARLSAAGASNAQIEMLRQMQAERAKLIEQQDVQRQKEAELASAAAATEAALKASAEAAKADAEAIKDALKTPEEKLKEQIAKIKTLEGKGLLSAEQSAAAQAKATQDASKTAGGGMGQEPRFAGAAMRGSGEAFSTILRSMGRKDPNVAATEKQTKDLVAAMKQNKPEFAVAEGA